jgi:hypothetical protein
VAAYEIRGQFLEACDCSVPCPCWFSEEPEADECTGVIAWHIDQGKIDGVDVAGLTAVSVSTHGGHREDAKENAKMRLSLFVDEEASDDQRRVIGRAFTGQLGGPLAELAQMSDDDPDVERAQIEFKSDGANTKLTAGKAVRAELSPVVGATGRTITVADSVLSVVLGPLGEVNRSDKLVLDVPRHDLAMDLEGVSGTHGRFAYVKKR